MRGHRGSGPRQGWCSPAIVVFAALCAFGADAHAQRQERDGKSVVDAVCAKCHRSGEGGAPRIGDRAAWVPHMRKGLDELVASAIHGHGAMPARGGMAGLTDPEVRAAIVAMFNDGLPPAAAAPAVAPRDDPRHQVVAGTDVYLGLMRAESLDAQAGVARRDVPPSGKGYYHLNISLADNQSHVPVTDAQVQVRVSDGTRSESKTLDVVGANSVVSYGNWFRFESGNAYDITAAIKRPGMASPIQARFRFKAP